MKLYPLKMKPVFKQYLWGGSNLKKVYGKDTPDGFAAESWEVSCHPNGLSAVANGAYEGKTLQEVIDLHGKDILGSTIPVGERFPLLVKLLDARDKLSVQVHPNDDYAFRNEGGEKGKTEMWYVLSCKEGASLVYGMREGVTRESFAKALSAGRLEEVLNEVPVRPGDVFFIPAGTVHAIGDGIMIAEIQQSSDATYRVYDYGRRDDRGNLRELHVEKAMEVMDFSGAEGCGRASGTAVREGASRRTALAACDYFVTDLLELDGASEEDTRGRMELLIITRGEGRADGVPFAAGDTLVIPAALGRYRLEGSCAMLKVFVPER